ncbi:uncharacterized protein [Ptychodera flava]
MADKNQLTLCSSKTCEICVKDFDTSRNLIRHKKTVSHEREKRCLLLENADRQVTNKRLCPDSDNSTYKEIEYTVSLANFEESAMHIQIVKDGELTNDDDFITDDLCEDEELTEQEVCEEDIASTCPEEYENPWYPFPDEHYAELSCLVNAPKPLGDANLQYIFHLLRKRDPSTPSLFKVREVCSKLPGRMEVNTFADTEGKEFTSLSVINIIRQRMAIPSIASKLARYPQRSSSGIIREMYQSKKWILDRRYHTPMVSEHGIDFFVKEFVWAKYECKKIIGYLSSIFTEASPTDSTYPETYAELIICRLHDEKLCFTTNTVKVATSDLISQYDGPMNTDLVGWKITKDSTIVKLSHDKSKSLCEDNILRKNAKGKKVVSVPVVLFSDDVGGSSTHKWNAFSVWCLMLGGLPKKENNDLQNILFLNASNSVSALELSKPLVAELKVLENLGVTMYDASLGEEVMVVSPVFLVKADNKRQSDVVSHLGSCAVKFCQKCTISRVDDDVTTVGDVRSKQFVQEAIGKIKDAESES